MKEIFLVHDTQEGPMARQSFLEMAGYQVTPMQSGDECLRLLQLHQPDLIILDVLLSGRNGFEVCREIRAKFPPEELPIILCSELYRTRLFREEATNSGAQRYLLKPLGLDQLVAHVNQLTGSIGQELQAGEGPAAA